MTFDEYQAAAIRTANHCEEPLAREALGLTGEAGEFADMIKKRIYHGHDISDDDLARELGDVLWYLAVAAHDLGLTLEEVAAINIAKLRKRYPDGFSQEASRNRTE